MGATRTVRVDALLVEYMQATASVRKLRDRTKVLQRQILLKAGWKVHAPGSTGWLKGIERHVASNPKSKVTAGFYQRYYANKEVWVDPVMKDLLFMVSYAWTRHFGRISRSCDLIANGVEARA
jgi:hypothetical protein